MKTLLYLAAPYSHVKREIEYQRFYAVNAAAAALILKGYLVFSPISHCHPIVCGAPKLQGYWETWHEFDKRLLEACDEFVVLRLPGWDISQGVAAETALARARLMPMSFCDPDTHHLTKAII